ncbi:MAG: M28 family peptidase [Abditibacteriota bacterium]|nr:M28 family peptidase [Abditibacteriota bacterium]
MKINKGFIINIVYAIIFLVALFFLFVYPWTDSSLAKKKLEFDPNAVSVRPTPEWLTQRYADLIGAVSTDNLQKTVTDMSGFSSSRVTGYPGCDMAADYIIKAFKDAGLKGFTSDEVEVHPFKVTVPIEHESKLVVGDETIKIYALWPNLARTSQVDKNGIDVHLIDGGNSLAVSFDGKKVKDSATVLNFNIGTNWLNASRLGSKAILFREPDGQISRGEAEAKFSNIPINIPRFWLPKESAERVDQLMAQGNDKARIYCDMSWDKVEGKNIVGVIPGTDPELKDEWVVINAYYDGISVVPGIAPSAESSTGIAAMLEMVRIFSQPEFAPKRSIMFVALSGHFETLSGMRNFIHQQIDSYVRPSMAERALHKIGLKKGELNDPPKFYMWAGLDLNSQTPGVGLFYKAYFYDNKEDIQKFVSPIGTTARETAERLANIYDYKTNFSEHYADAINPVGGKTWRGLIPSRFAFDQEVITGASQRGLTFATVNDNRRLVDTPFDTPDRVNYGNIKTQMEMIMCITDHWFRDPAVVSAEEVIEAEVVDRNTVKYKDEKDMGYLIGVFVKKSGKGENFFRHSETRYLPKVNSNCEFKLKKPLPNGFNKGDTIYIRQEKISRLGVSKPQEFSRLTIRGGFSTLSGDVVKYDPKKSFVPNLEVEDSLVVLKSWYKSLTGVRAAYIERTEVVGEGENKKTAHYTLPGVVNTTMTYFNKQVFISAFRTSRENGDIISAPDIGNYGEYYPKTFKITTAYKEVPIIVFDCTATSVYELLDTQGLRSLTGISVYDGITDGNPKQYYRDVSNPDSPLVEDTAVIFAEETPESKKGLAKVPIKIIMNAGPRANRLLLVNSSDEKPEGEGYDFSRGGVLDETAYRAAKDMYALNKFRLDSLSSKGIKNQALQELNDMAGENLLAAEHAKNTDRYSIFDSYSRTAWGFASRAYPDIAATSQDVVNGVIFYLFLLIPFAYFCERLFFAFPEIKWQLVGFFGIFIAIFFIFRFVHPAFDIAGNPLIVLIAFIMLSLSGVVIFIVIGKFEEQLKELAAASMGSKGSEGGKVAVAGAAFSLGVSNMRRRKTRTVLTCVTLILLTFIVLSFTSVTSVIRMNKIPVKAKPGIKIYNGILVRMPNWQSLQEVSYKVLYDEYKRDKKVGNLVAPRAWFYGISPMEFNLQPLINGDKLYSARALVGLSPDEAGIMGIYNSNSKILKYGDWFGYENGVYTGNVDPHSLIIPDTIAESLEITKDNYKDKKIEFAGSVYKVVGVVNPAAIKAHRDLDNEIITPADLLLMGATKVSQGGGEAEEDAGFVEFTHIDPSAVFYIPYETSIVLGGEIKSIAVKLGSGDVEDSLASLMKRINLNLYAGIDGRIYRFSSLSGKSSQGMTSLIIPIIIAALIVLNTMMSSVYERTKEIGIYSSIGLSPQHIAMLFMAESLVYAILGAVSGYVIGQILSKIIMVTNIMPGLYLNFSSMSAVIATLVVSGVVILSTIYPSRMASRVATPAVDRIWKLEEPEGDHWVVKLPFAITGKQTMGITYFIGEWINSHEEYSLGDFVTKNVQLSNYEENGEMVYCIKFRSWIAPFDLGVSQDTLIKIVPTELEGTYEVRIEFDRVSGDASNWIRVNRRFLHACRKQFLIWRTIKAEDREKYMAEAEKVVTSAGSLNGA